MSNSAVFVGEGSLLIRCAEVWLDRGQIVAAVVSGQPRIVAWAKSNGLRIVEPGPDGKFALEGLEFDYLFSVANLRPIAQGVIAQARRLAINFHDSLLPRYAGLNATSWALINRETTHGITWHEMTAEIDGGRVVRQVSFPVAPDETALSLNAKCYEAGLSGFAEITRDAGTGQIPLRPQIGERTYFGRSARPVAAATLDFRQPAETIEALVRALDFGTYVNPLAIPKIVLGKSVILARTAKIINAAPSAAPGTVVALDDDAIGIATPTGDLQLGGLSAADGSPLGPWSTRDIRIGQVLPALDPATERAFAERLATLASAERFWSSRFALHPAELPYPRQRGAAEAPLTPLSQPIRPTIAKGQTSVSGLIAGYVAWLARLTSQQRVSVRYVPATSSSDDPLAPWLAPYLPLSTSIDSAAHPSALIAAVDVELTAIEHAGPHPCDLPVRTAGGSQTLAGLRGLKLGVAIAERSARISSLDGQDLVLSIDVADGSARLLADSRAFAVETVEVMARHLAHFISAFLAPDAEQSIGAIALCPPEERDAIRRTNQTSAPFDAESRSVLQFEAQAARTPDRPAIICNDETLTYRELNQRADAIAALLAASGIGAGSIVGLALDRSSDLVIALLAIQKTGAAYLPLDPHYPQKRIQWMVEDSKVAMVVTSAAIAAQFPVFGERTFLIDRPATPPKKQAAGLGEHARDLAYVIYTSGSTGRPKGVMIRHRNVMNFFAGMDQRVPHDPPGRWLAVTSLSFDISVLELCWTLARGFTVVLHAGASRPAASAGPQFSLFYFASEAGSGGDAYRLLMEGAKFADREGFTAVWTPERHFHAFGGPYPNAAVTSAAVAAVTERVGIRAGSCVLPLHHPIKVAEDWAVVDNLSRGRVGISFAAGWQPNDFVVAPHAFKDRKNLMLSGIDTVRRLWRGEAVACQSGSGQMVDIRTLPRPIQKELPVWLTAAGNPETYRQAGELGCSVLTHLLGQSISELAEKLRAYRQAWSDAGHPGHGHVTLMLHTFVGTDEGQVKETVRAPLKNYLRSSVDLIRDAAWTFPTFVQHGGRNPAEDLDTEALSDEVLDALLEHAFERYFVSSGLFGTPESCMARIEQLQQIGVDEIACLIDFGVETETVLGHLPYLKQLMDRARPTVDAGGPSIPEQIDTHAITHFQCTPSMVSMLVADAAGRSALSRLGALMVGGEALPLPLARQLRTLLTGKLLNMYGPTETTVWSSTCALDEIGDRIPLGTPIANTRLHVLDAVGQECPALVPGELHIGGEGLALGYLGRPDLTGERFIRDPLSASENDRLYRTGDLVRRHANGDLEWLARIDQQVKIRGHRIEIAEIEAVLQQQPGVKEAVVVARDEANQQKRLVGYVTARPGATLDPEKLRGAAAEQLPEIMVPSTIVLLPALPLTPNGKVDRNALPALGDVAKASTGVAPTSQLEKSIAAIWCEALGRDRVGSTDNFFDIGGHSLLVVHVQRRLQEVIGREIPITDMFRYSTIHLLAKHIEGELADTAVETGISRAAARKARLRGRQVQVSV